MYLIEHDEETDVSSHRFLLCGKRDMFARGLNLIISMSPDANRENAAYAYPLLFFFKIFLQAMYIHIFSPHIIGTSENSEETRVSNDTVSTIPDSHQRMHPSSTCMTEMRV